MNRYLPWLKNSYKRTNTFPRDEPNGLPYCKDFWCVSSVAMRCTGLLGENPSTGCITTDARVRMDIAGHRVHGAPTVRFGKIIALLENEKLIQSEIDRRREAAGKTDPCERRKEILRSEQARLRNKMERLITAYQDGLLTLEQLRERMPHLKQQSQAVNSELQLLEMAKLDQAKYLKLAESLGGFRNKLRARAQTLDLTERQQILRLLVKEILVGFDTLTIRHSIPIPSGDGSPPNIPGSTPGSAPSPQSDYPLRPRRIRAGPGQKSSGDQLNARTMARLRDGKSAEKVTLDVSATINSLTLGGATGGTGTSV